ncbi:MAG: hypothetical protein QM813_20565 [Verrucomicrobiota bacterium]
MKPITFCVLGLVLALLAGCVVTSVYPYYTAKDLTFDPTLLGVWGDAENTNDSKDTWVFEKISTETYRLTVQSNSETNEFDTHLFTLGGHQFLDSLPRARVDYQTPTHVVLRVKNINPTLQLQLLSYEWLGKLVEQNPKTIRHIIVPAEAGKDNEGVRLTLTANTEELQKFLRQHLNNTNAWLEPMVLKKR